MHYNVTIFRANSQRHYRRNLLYVLLAMLGSGLCFPARAQFNQLTEKINLQLHRTTAQQLIEETDRQSRYAFLFAAEHLSRISIDHFESKQQPLGEVLTLLQKKYGLQFAIADGNIAVKPGPAPPHPLPTPHTPKKDPGRAVGKIVDEETGQPVTDVTIRIGNKGAVSAIDGSFSIALPKGKYEAELSAVGYGKKTITDIEIKDNEVFELNITLKREKGSLSAVTVKASARRESVASLYARQKNNAGITDGISAEQIARTPDKNVADVLKRVSGLSVMDNKYVVVRGLSERYNQSMLNGQIMPSTELNRKQFSFDVIPANLIDNIVVSKTITPDQSAEFGGGLIHVTTKDLPAQDFFSVTAGGSYNDMTTGRNFRTLPLEGKEYFGQAASHRKLFGSLNWKSTGDILQHAAHLQGDDYLVPDVKSFTNNWGLYQFNAQPSQNYQVSGGKVIRLKNENRKLGFTASISYRNTLQTQDVLMGTNGFGGAADLAVPLFQGKRYGFTTNLGGLFAAGYTTPRSKLIFNSLYLQTLDQQLILGAGDHQDPSGFFLGYFDLTTQTSLWQNQFNGEQAIGKKGIKVNWMVSHARLDKLKPDNHNLMAPYIQAPDREPEEINIANAYATAGPFGGLRFWSRAFENNFTYNADISIPFRFKVLSKMVSNTFKTGYAGWTKDRLFFVLNSGSLPNVSKTPALGSAFAPENMNKIGFSRFGDDFDTTASLHAFYGMLDHKIGRFRLVWGLRGEYYNINKISKALAREIRNVNESRGGRDTFDFSALYNREPNWHFFPTANLTFNLTSKMNLRLAYAESIIRPDLREMAFFKEYDFELGGEYTSSLTRSTTAQHIDFRYEWYPAPGEIISVSAFYKKFDYPMEIYQYDNRIFQMRNNKQAVNKGIEVEVRKSFAFTGIPVLRNMTVYGNLTMMGAWVTPMTINYNALAAGSAYKIVPEEKIEPEEKRPQAGASNYIYNAALYYDTKPVSLSVSWNLTANRMYRPVRPYQASFFEQPLQSLDAQVAIRLLKQRATIRLNAANLLNSYSLIYYNQYSDLLGPTHNRTPTTKEFLYQKDLDIVNYQAKPGRTYSFSFSYNF